MQLEFEDLAELLAYLRGFTTWKGDPTEYDFGAMRELFAACVDSLRNRALKAEMEDLRWMLSGERRQFLIDLAELVKNPVDEPE